MYMSVYVEKVAYIEDICYRRRTAHMYMSVYVEKVAYTEDIGIYIRI